jgi:hypothetical protein
MLIPLPLNSELRIAVSSSTPARRRTFILVLTAGNAPQRLCSPMPLRHAFCLLPVLDSPYDCSASVRFGLQLLENVAAAARRVGLVP